MTRIVDGLGCLDGQAIQTTERISIHCLVERTLRIQYAGGTLRRCRAIKKCKISVS